MKHEARAFLDIDTGTAIPGFRQAAEAEGLPQSMDGEDLLLRLQIGTIRISAADQRTAVDIDAADPVGLQILRDLLAERVESLGLRLDWQTRPGLKRPANLSLARVESVERISVSYIRVKVKGSDLSRFADGGLHFRILLGPGGTPWPGVDAGGVTQWPGGIGAWHRPVYTTRALELLPAEGLTRITFDVFLHEGGRVTEWAGRAQAGDEIALTGPGGSDVPGSRWIGLVGDETALPVIARILGGVGPDTTGEVVLFVPSGEDVQQLVHPAGVRVRWVLRGGVEAPLDALAGMEMPKSGRYVFFAAERKEAVAARAHLSGLGLSRGEFLAAAYWTADG